MNKSICNGCGIKFCNHSNLVRHVKSKHENDSHSCEICGKNFNRKDMLLSHQKIHSTKRKESVESTFIALPPSIKKKHAVVNVQNKDNKSFMWALYSALYPPDNHGHRVSQYKCYEDVLIFDDIEFPVKLQDIDKFEKLNYVSVNVYGVTENNKVFPLKIAKEEQEDQVNLLYLTNETTFHYAWIKNLSRLVSSQLSRHDGRIYTERKFISNADSQTDTHTCNKCGVRFSRCRDLFRHVKAKHENEYHFCKTCGKNFNRKDNMLRHERLHSTKIKIEKFVDSN